MALAVDPVASSTIYALGSAGLLSSINRGSNCDAIAIDPVTAWLSIFRHRAAAK